MSRFQPMGKGLIASTLPLTSRSFILEDYRWEGSHEIDTPIEVRAGHWLYRKFSGTFDTTRPKTKTREKRKTTELAQRKAHLEQSQSSHASSSPSVGLPDASPPSRDGSLSL